MLEMLSKIESALEVPNFIFTVIIPACENEKLKKEKENKRIKNYAIKKVNELDNKFYDFDYNKNKAVKMSLLKILERVLKVKEVQLYYTNLEDKQLIDLCFEDCKNGENSIEGPLNIKCNELGILITLSDKMLEKDEYKKNAIEHIEKLINSGGEKR